jgi:hypothetical protein
MSFRPAVGAARCSVQIIARETNGIIIIDVVRKVAYGLRAYYYHSWCSALKLHMDCELIIIIHNVVR